MFGELDAQLRETDILIDELRNNLKRLHNYSGEERRLKQKECGQIISQLRTVKDSFVLELRSMDKELRSSYEEAMRERIRIFKNLVQEYEAKKHELDRTVLAAEAEQEEMNPHLMTSQQLAQRGDDVQDQTQESIDRMKQMVVEAEEIGQATVEKMDQQIDQMNKIQGGLTDMEYNLQRARGTVGAIAKSAASDRCIQILCIAIWVCVVIILILIFTK